MQDQQYEQQQDRWAMIHIIAIVVLSAVAIIDSTL
jgi:hypothetical protein